jgi:hypothetical protein
MYHLEVRANDCRFFTAIITPKSNDVIVVYGKLERLCHSNQIGRIILISIPYILGTSSATLKECDLLNKELRPKIK